MSALDRPTIDKAAEVIEAAHNELSGLCNGKRKFRMSIPVQEDDTDIVIGNALYIADAMRAKIAKAHAVVTRALSEHGNDTATLVEIATILEE